MTDSVNLICAGLILLLALLRASRTVAATRPLAGAYLLAFAFTSAAAAALHSSVLDLDIFPLPNAPSTAGTLTLALVSSVLITLCTPVALRALPRVRRQLQSERLPLFLSGASAALIALESTGGKPIAPLPVSLTGAGLGLLFALSALTLAWLRESSRLSSASAALPLRSESDFDLARSLLFLALLIFCLLALAGVL